MPVVQHHWQSVESAAFRSWPFKIPSKPSDQVHVALGLEASEEPFRAGQAKRRKGHGRVFVGRAGLAAFSAAARAFKGRDVAEIGGLQVTAESMISFSAAAGDGLQSTRSGLPRRRASRTPDLLTC